MNALRTLPGIALLARAIWSAPALVAQTPDASLLTRYLEEHVPAGGR